MSHVDAETKKHVLLFSVYENVKNVYNNKKTQTFGHEYDMKRNINISFVAQPFTSLIK